MRGAMGRKRKTGEKLPKYVYPHGNWYLWRADKLGLGPPVKLIRTDAPVSAVWAAWEDLLGVRVTNIRVRTESDLLHDHGLTAEPGYYVVEEFDRVPATASGASYKPPPNILEGPITTEPQANHIAHTRFGMEVR